MEEGARSREGRPSIFDPRGGRGRLFELRLQAPAQRSRICAPEPAAVQSCPTPFFWFISRMVLRLWQL